MDTIVESRVGLTMLYSLKQKNNFEWHHAYDTFQLSLGMICQSSSSIICGLLGCINLNKNSSNNQSDEDVLPTAIPFNSIDSNSIAKLVKEEICLLNHTSEINDILSTRLIWNLAILIRYLL